LSLTFGHDRVLLNWYTPIGGTRRTGARQLAIAAVGAAEMGLEDVRQRIRAETQLALERLEAAKRAVARARVALDGMQERLPLVQQLVDAGRQEPLASVTAADQLAVATRQWIDARLLHALALAELRRATGSIPVAADGAELARFFSTEP
jgi:outer membrane protein TolC